MDDLVSYSYAEFSEKEEKRIQKKLAKKVNSNRRVICDSSSES